MTALLTKKRAGGGIVKESISGKEAEVSEYPVDNL